jgi:hypothetical protein
LLAFHDVLGYRHHSLISCSLASKEPMNRNRALSLLLALIPFLAICFTVPLWTRVYPLVLGLPFNLFWFIAWIPLTSVCMAGVYRL